ncbi:MAG: DUF6064 family protein [Thalassobaculaceae bacterium]
METWLSYSPQDFLLFSERVYWRLFELHNAALWPAQIPAVVVGLAVVFLILRPRPWSGRALAVVLAVAWVVAGLGFMPRYATINWAAANLVPAFLGYAALVAAFGFLARALEPQRSQPAQWAAVGLCLYGLAVPPLLAVLADRPASAEVFGLMPDPTAIVTLGAVLAAGRRWPTLLLAVFPAVWCVASWATLAILGTAQAWMFAPVALAVLAILMLGGRLGDVQEEETAPSPEDRR